MSAVMPRTLLVHGLKRSGNHAVINWLLAQGNFRFFNNVVPVGPILRGQRALPAPWSFADWSTQHPAAPGQDRCLSLEDHPLDLPLFSDPPQGLQHILILRDPANLFASRIRKGATMEHPAYSREEGPLLRRAVDLWKSHAREFLGATNVLPGYVGVWFDAWFASEEYRRKLSSSLGLSFTDAGFTQVSDRGGGSSFDRTTFDGANRRMQVLTRHAQLDETERSLLDKILSDPEVNNLATALRACFIPGKPS